jgi:hypothetical protein
VQPSSPPQAQEQQQHLQQQAPPDMPSKDVIMRRIDSLDAQIEALEGQLAGIRQALEADARRESELDAEMAGLQVAAAMEMAETLGDEESMHNAEVK